MSLGKGQQSQEAFYDNCHHSTFYNQFEAKTLLVTNHQMASWSETIEVRKNY